MDTENNLEFVSALRTVVTRLIKKLRKESATGRQLSLTERSTLGLLLNYGSLQPTELAAMEKITNQSMSQIVNKLSAQKLITRTASETDGRKAIIELTADGQHLIMQIRSERDEWLANAINKTCTPEEQEILKKAIGPLTKLVDFE